MATWMTHFLTLLSTNNALLVTQDREETGLMEQVKAQICENVTMYAQKYDEEFTTHLPSFVTTIWNLLITTGSEVKYDQLVSSAIQFLASVAERPAYKQLFADQNTLNGICEKVIVPNMVFRDADEEAFEDNAEEYMRRDVEGSDVDTRRRAACDLVRALCKSFEGPVIQIFSAYVQHMLTEFANNPSKNWKSKDAAIFLVTSLAAKAQTQKHGITQTSDLVNVTDFFNSHIVPGLQAADVSANPVLKADAIKYLLVFRSQLSREVLINSLGPVVKLLEAPSQVVHSYAALCIERLLTNLFLAMNKDGSQENEYIMKAVMRSLAVLQEVFVPYVATLITQLTEKLLVVSKNPSKPHFNHFLFESICIVISTTCKLNPAAITSFEDGLFPPFQTILQQDVQEFIPYIFQVLALMLEMHTEGNVPAPYLALFPHLLVPVLWSRDGNIPPLVRLLQAYITKGVQQIGADKMPGVLGVFQKLLASKLNDAHGFALMNSLIRHATTDMLAQYIQQIFVLMFQRLQSSKTTKYVKCLLVFFSLYCIKYGATSLIDVVDKIQANMFGMVVEKLFVADLQKVSSRLDRKICAVGVTKILTESPAMLQPTYVQLWPQLLQTLIGLFELPRDETATGDEIPHIGDTENDSSGFQAVYSQLVFAAKLDDDPCPDVSDVKTHLAKNLHTLCSAQPNVRDMIRSGLTAEPQNFLQQYFTAAGVQIS